MLSKLWVRLTGAFLLIGLVIVIMMAFIINLTVENSFRGYIGQQNGINNTEATIDTLTTHYSQNDTWAGAERLLPGQNVGERRGSGGAQFSLADIDGVIVASTQEKKIGDTLSQSDLSYAHQLRSDGQIVGWLLVETPGENRLNTAQTQFLVEVRRSLIYVGLLAIGLALLIGISMSHLLTRPLSDLTGAAQTLAKGKFGHTVTIKPNVAGEIKTLAETFNYMSDALEKGELQRQRMAADIAHELRTPLSVMRGQIQSMLDGVTELSQEQIAVAYEQTLHLIHLVNDLRTLTQAEAGHLPLDKHPCSPADVVNHIGTLFAPLAEDAHLTLTISASDALPYVAIDANRIQQVLANLVANALSHTTPGGRIEISVRQHDSHIRFMVANDGISLTPDQAEHVFERFWRADDSRTRDSGGAGLGLAISREIVHLHDGSMSVNLTNSQTQFIFDLPITIT